MTSIVTAPNGNDRYFISNITDLTNVYHLTVQDIAVALSRLFDGIQVSQVGAVKTITVPNDIPEHTLNSYFRYLFSYKLMSDMEVEQQITQKPSLESSLTIWNNAHCTSVETSPAFTLLSGMRPEQLAYLIHSNTGYGVFVDNNMIIIINKTLTKERVVDIIRHELKMFCRHTPLEQLNQWMRAKVE